MAITRVLFRLSKSGIVQRRTIWNSAPQSPLHTLANTCSSLSAFNSSPSTMIFSRVERQLQRCSYPMTPYIQRFSYSSSATHHQNDKDSSPSSEHDNASKKDSGDDNQDVHSQPSDGSHPEKTDGEDELSMENLATLVLEKEELLKVKHKEIEALQEKVLRSYAEMENVIGRTKREAENSKKFAVQNFAKNLLDVADNLERASSVVKGSISKADLPKESDNAMQLLKTLLDGVEMTEKQLLEVFRKFGIEKFNPENEAFDPNGHHAVFEVPDPSKPAGSVAVVLKPGYMIYDRVLRPAEVGVTVAPSGGGGGGEADASSSAGDAAGSSSAS